jgi:hypothetical protein
MDRARFHAPEIEDLIALNKGDKCVHFWGFINYDNGLGKISETKFHFVWNSMPFYGACAGFWAKCGTPEENSET